MHWLDHLDQTHHANFDLIKNACIFACKNEKTNTPFSLSTLTQGLAMADVLLTLQSDDYIIAAAILYPAIFYNAALTEKLNETTDKTICKLITGAMQMDIIHSAYSDKSEKTGQQNQIDNLRKMMLAMVDDIRTVLLKLSERLIMLQHLGRLPSEKQLQIAQDTMDYYAPLANRLGIGHIKWQLEDWAFRYINPTEYQKISSAFHMRQKDRVQFIHQTIAELKKLLAENNIKNVKISGRIKHIYSIYKKIQRKETTFEHIYDTNAIRILVPTVRDCYTALSLVHSRWTPITKEFDDYIAKPKSNNYQSIHTAITTENGLILEIQIRTVEMHEKAELGIAAHWKYKENKSHHHDDHKIHLLRELLETQTHLYPEAFHDRVYVFSPTGNVFDLEKGATSLDFAYLVHSDVGNRCRGAKINNVLMPLTYELKTGDHIDILTTKEPHPSRDWLRADLGFLKTTHAKQKVRQWFKKQDQEKYLSDGLSIWEKLAKQNHFEKSMIEKIFSEFDLKNSNALLISLGNASISPAALLNKLTDSHQKPRDEIIIEKEREKKEALSSPAFSVQGEKHLLTQLAKCCRPIPGDIIMGYITKGRGITVHQKKCRNIIDAQKNRPEKLIDISWENQTNKNYRVNLEIHCEDRSGLLRDVSGIIAQLNLSIFAINSRLNKNNAMATISLTVEINNQNILNDMMKKIRQIKGVMDVRRK
ncbi:MAG: hypothetical protein A3E81_05950 [Gammaproteobacteria bacterium RIFCSPHIGHO2_12_FULL_36_30]|nr:MAG: hypothetical protein A3E81_05950 [Gammaproteobacteria bacterium RIFCSPHIGHO2_12_FULL_36_30]